MRDTTTTETQRPERLNREIRLGFGFAQKV
jgi:hypothetical protein